MSGPRIEQGIRLVSKSHLASDITAFLVDRQARGLSAGTVEFYRKKLRYVQAYLEARDVPSVQDVTPHLLRRLLIDLGQRLNPGGVHAVYRAVRTFLRWHWAEYDLRERNPIIKVEALRVPQHSLEPVPLPDVKAMLATCRRRTFSGDRDRAILLALLDTGCRASEFLAVNVGDVNLGTGAVQVSHGKGSKARVTFLGAKSRRALVRYLRHRPGAESADPLWIARGGTRLKYSGLRQIVRRRALG